MMDPSSSQQPTPAIKHMMTVPDKIELTSTGAYSSPPRAGSGQRGDAGAYRAMRVPDKIMLETAGRGEAESEGGSGGGVTGEYFQQPQEPPPAPSTAPKPRQDASAAAAMASEQREVLRGFERRLQGLEVQVRGLQQAVLQGGGGARRRGEGSRVWYALTFAGWLMVPLVVVFMFHYRKTAQ